MSAPGTAPMPTLFSGDSVKLTGFGWRIIETDEQAQALQGSDGIEKIINTDWRGKRGERVIWEHAALPASLPAPPAVTREQLQQVETEIRAIESDYASRGGQMAGNPRLRGLRAAIEPLVRALSATPTPGEGT